MGAWIETKYYHNTDQEQTVAPYVGAWIETKYVKAPVKEKHKSHPTWVRGLKLISMV